MFGVPRSSFRLTASSGLMRETESSLSAWLQGGVPVHARRIHEFPWQLNLNSLVPECLALL